MPPDSHHLLAQVVWLFVLAIPVSCVAWTVTHEEVFREPREFCQRMSSTCDRLVKRKFFYLFTCEYCFSHYVSAGFILLTGYRLLLDDWRGYVLSFFALVWVANAYMSLFARLRVDIRSERAIEYGSLVSPTPPRMTDVSVRRQVAPTRGANRFFWSLTPRSFGIAPLPPISIWLVSRL